jgi:hypothetical protein
MVEEVVIRRCASTAHRSGQELLVNEIAAQRRIVGVRGAEEQADLALGITHARLEGLCDRVQQ